VKHLLLLFYLMALVAGSAAISQAFLIWQRYRRAVIRWYALFLLSLLLVLLYFLAAQYAAVTGLSGDRTMQAVLWILPAAGSLLFIVVAPYFYASLLGLAMPRALRFLFLALDAVVFAAAGLDLAVPAQPVALVVLLGSLFGMIAGGIVLIAVKLHTVADRALRLALALFLGLSALFFPFMLMDSLFSFASFLAVFRPLEGFPQPLYFLVLNCLTIAFALRYLNRPAYAEKDGLTDYFLSTFHVTDREAQVIRHLLQGAGVQRIAEVMFISPKTVENHVYNIYQKLKVRNRVQLFQLIRANALD
jgi:DNA-binding CsgD family transcriptional regulator